jgi:nitroimidazol reductase NimA-like FMN-containing flavoprotein (pyridoxamine 5'-phosphate oxidase superfamily)
MATELIDRAKTLLASLEYINVATASPDGQPWNTPVYARYDERLHFYWCSWKDAEHSINLRGNPQVFFTLYDSTRKRGDNNMRCLYVQGHAYEIEEATEIANGLRLLYPHDESEQDVAKVQGDSVRRLYKIIPEMFWLNDKSERQVTRETIKMRVEVPFDQLLHAI